MVSAAPCFNRHSGLTQIENRILGNDEGFRAWVADWESIVAKNPRWMCISTWNDYLEGSYVGSQYASDELWPTYRGNHLDHGAFREIAEYYIRWWKAQSQPTISEDFVAIAHRTHPKATAGANAGGVGIEDDTDNAQDDSGTIRPLIRQLNYEFTEDRLYGYVRLTSPADVTLYSGATQQTFSLASGIHELSMPFGIGTQSIEVQRGGVTVKSATSATQVLDGPVSLFNYNYESTASRVSAPDEEMPET